MGYSSSRTVLDHLDRLEEGEYIERESAPSRKRRPLRLTPKGWEAVSTRPLMGRVAAGRGLEAVANEEPYSLVAELLSSRSGRRRFLLGTKGDSMTGAGVIEPILQRGAAKETPGYHRRRGGHRVDLAA